VDWGRRPVVIQPELFPAFQVSTLETVLLNLDILHTMISSLDGWTSDLAGENKETPKSGTWLVEMRLKSLRFGS